MLLQTINTRTHFEKLFLAENEKFVNYFRGKVSDEDFEAIKALAGKIEHMTLSIGCPISVEPMLRSICSRKVKRWLGVSLYYGNLERGKQLRSRDELGIANKSAQYERHENCMIEKGHFRWNRKAYTLSRPCTDLLQEYFKL